jgi:hypothetical protein
LAGLLSSKCHFALNLVAIARLDEVGTHEKQNNLCGLESHINLAAPVCAGRNHSIVPLQDSAIAFVHNELAANIVHEIFVLVGI